MMYVQYVILYYIVGPTCRGLNSHVRAVLADLSIGVFLWIAISSIAPIGASP